MPPTPGKIHKLPIKVYYTLDSSSETYSTTLSERYDVFVHPSTSRAPPAPSNHARTANGPSRANPGQPPVKGGAKQQSVAPPPSSMVEDVTGSCALKNVAWGVCFASPECVPAPTFHDFSVYSLDTLNRPSTSLARAFQPASASTSSSPSATNGANGPTSAKNGESGAWHGKGFLSWALYEDGSGSTLVRGRLVRSAEFDGLHNAEGGLEGLMMAEGRRSRGDSGDDGGDTRNSGHRNGEIRNASGNGLDDETEDWGLEVNLSLKMVHLGGRAVGDRTEFREMIARGKEIVSNATTGIGGSGGVSGRGAVPSPNLQSHNGSELPSHPSQPQPIRASAGQPRRIEPRLISQPSSTANNNGIFTTLNTPSTTTSSAPMGQMTSHQSGPSLQRTANQAGPSRDSLPPSSLPMAPTSSNQDSKRDSGKPPSRPATSSEHRSSSVIPRTGHSSSSVPPPSSISAMASAAAGSGGTSHGTAPSSFGQSGPSAFTSDNTPQSTPPKRDHRDITPPPPPPRSSPPPSTPSRAALHALLRSDGKMSPEMASRIANNPALIKLLKSIPTHIAQQALRSPFKTSSLSTSHPPAFQSSPTRAKGSPATSASDFATPASTITITAPTPTATATAGTSRKNGALASKNAPGGSDVPSKAGHVCDNCGTSETDLWRTKKGQDGKLVKVCNQCGLYFNKHKRMRPVDMFSTPSTSNTNNGKGKTGGTTTNGTEREGSTGKRAKVEEPAHGVRSSPRRSVARGTTSSHTSQPSANHAQSHGQPGRSPSADQRHSDDHVRRGSATSANESPHKKRKGAPPAPSPRRNTRAAAKEMQAVPFDPPNTHGSPLSKGSTATSATLVHPSPSDRMADKRKVQSGETNGTSAVDNQSQHENGANSNHPTSIGKDLADGHSDEEVNIEALLAQFVVAAGSTDFSGFNHTTTGDSNNRGSDATGNASGDFSLENGNDMMDLDKWFAEAGIDLSNPSALVAADGSGDALAGNGGNGGEDMAFLNDLFDFDATGQ